MIHVYFSVGSHDLLCVKRRTCEVSAFLDSQFCAVIENSIGEPLLPLFTDVFPAANDPRSLLHVKYDGITLELCSVDSLGQHDEPIIVRAFVGYDECVGRPQGLRFAIPGGLCVMLSCKDESDFVFPTLKPFIFSIFQLCIFLGRGGSP